MRSEYEFEDQKIKRFVHSPLEVEHNGIKAAIKENGKIDLSNMSAKDSKPAIEIPASLVFKLAQLLKATRKVKYVTVSEVDESERDASERNERLPSVPEKV